MIKEHNLSRPCLADPAWEILSGKILIDQRGGVRGASPRTAGSRVLCGTMNRSTSPGTFFGAPKNLQSIPRQIPPSGRFFPGENLRGIQPKIPIFSQRTVGADASIIRRKKKPLTDHLSGPHIKGETACAPLSPAGYTADGGPPTLGLLQAAPTAFCGRAASPTSSPRWTSRSSPTVPGVGNSSRSFSRLGVSSSSPHLNPLSRLA